MIILASISSGAIAGIIIGILAFIILIIVASGIKVVRQSTAVIVERLGRYHRTLNTGIHWIMPILDRASRPISLKEIVADFKPQPVITRHRRLFRHHRSQAVYLRRRPPHLGYREPDGHYPA